MMEERKTSIATQIINSIKKGQINLLFLLLLPLLSIGQQTLSLEVLCFINKTILLPDKLSSTKSALEIEAIKLNYLRLT
jgi:hypothetical protein